MHSRLIFDGHISFCGVTDNPVLDFWWRLPWISKPRWIPLLACFIAYVQLVGLESGTYRGAASQRELYQLSYADYIKSPWNWFVRNKQRVKNRQKEVLD